MKIDERVVLAIPKSARTRSARQRTVCIRKLVTRAIMSIRAKVLDETGEDIFNVFAMTDCVEVSVRGEMETRHIEKEEFKPWMNRRYMRKIREMKKKGGA